MDDESPVLAAALRYAARGWAVFPCSPETKAPLVAGEGDDVGLDSMPGDPVELADDVDERALVAEDLLDGERANREDQGGLTDGHLAGEEGLAARDLLGRGPSIAAPFGLAREAAGDGGHVDALAELGLGDAHGLFKPAKEGAPGRPGEGAAKAPFARARGLAEEEDAAHDRGAVDDGADHRRAGPARVELPVEEGEPALRARACRSGPGHRRRGQPTRICIGRSIRPRRAFKNEAPTAPSTTR